MSIQKNLLSWVDSVSREEKKKKITDCFILPNMKSPVLCVDNIKQKKTPFHLADS